MNPENWIALAGILATTIVAVVTLVINRQREKQQQERDDRLRKEQQEREDKLRREQQEHEAEEEAKRRTYNPHIEFEIRCNFHGPQEGSLIAEVLLTARNKGLIQQKFKDIRLRVRGIEADQALSFWAGNEPRLNFPLKIVSDASLLPENYNFFFVEPGIEQTFTYVTKVPLSVRYILVHAEFEYDAFTPHTAERVFTVKTNGD